MDYLRSIISAAAAPEDIDKTLVFVPNRNVADRLWRELQTHAAKQFRQSGWLLVDRHLGDMALWEREDVERRFRDGDTRVLITVKTLEVGIDIGDVVRVVHWGVPTSLNELIQREGRAGRRPGHYESLIVVTTDREKQLVREYLRIATSPSGSAARYAYTPQINPRAMFIRMLRERIRNRRTIPRRIPIPLVNAEWPVSFYSQDSRRFRIVEHRNGRRRRLREVRIEDVVHRYLRGMIRPIRDFYIVTGVDPRTREVRVERLDDASLSRVWAGAVVDASWCLDVGDVRRGLLFTVGEVGTEYRVAESPIPHDLDIIVVRRWPERVKLIKKYYKEMTYRTPSATTSTSKPLHSV